MYRHILVALDNSPSDQAIVTHIVQLAALIQASVTLVHVADGFMARNQKYFDESSEIQEDREYLSRRQQEFEQAGIAVFTVLACGDPSREILAVADSRQCDLIAMATHGHGMLGDFIFGSVASTVRHRTHLPVLLIKGT